MAFSERHTFHELNQYVKQNVSTWIHGLAEPFSLPSIMKTRFLPSLQQTEEAIMRTDLMKWSTYKDLEVGGRCDAYRLEDERPHAMHEHHCPIRVNTYHKSKGFQCRSWWQSIETGLTFVKMTCGCLCTSCSTICFRLSRMAWNNRCVASMGRIAWVADAEVEEAVESSRYVAPYERCHQR